MNFSSTGHGCTPVPTDPMPETTQIIHSALRPSLALLFFSAPLLGAALLPGAFLVGIRAGLRSWGVRRASELAAAQEASGFFCFCLQPLLFGAGLSKMRGPSVCHGLDSLDPFKTNLPSFVLGCFTSETQKSPIPLASRTRGPSSSATSRSSICGATQNGVVL